MDNSISKLSLTAYHRMSIQELYDNYTKAELYKKIHYYRPTRFSSRRKIGVAHYLYNLLRADDYDIYWKMEKEKIKDRLGALNKKVDEIMKNKELRKLILDRFGICECF